jgi:uncharacterized alkaline shock family protein YloU
MAENRSGKTTIAPDVLLTIARMSAVSVEGVSRLAPVSGGFDNLFRKGGVGEGVRVKLEDNVAYLDLYLILKSNVNVREVSRHVQQTVTRAVSEMLGMEVGHIDIHIENIEYSE